jgi:putative Holliday junction resolvase
MRFLGLDIGTVRIGAALSDETGLIASPLTMIKAKQPFEALVKSLSQICEENEVGMLVVGMPLSMDGGGRGDSARMAKSMGKRLGEALKLKVAFVDERFTSIVAEQALLSSDMKRSKRKENIDKVAAAIMLQTFLDMRSR